MTSVGAPVRSNLRRALSALRTDRRPVRLAAIALLLCGAFAPALASAQDDDAAEALIEQGRAHRRDGNYAEARAAFERAIAAGAGARGHVQVAATDDAAGHRLDAALRLRDVLEMADDPYLEEHRADIQANYDRILGSLARIAVTGPDGARVHVGERDVGTLPLPAVLVAPGSVAVAVTPDGGERYVRVVDASPGAVVRVDAPAWSGAPEGPSPAGDDGPGAGPWVLLGVGLGVAVAGGVLLGLGQADVAAATSVDPGTYFSEVSESAERGVALSNAGIVVLSVGLAAAVGGLVWWVVAMSSGGAAPDARASRAR